MAFHGIPFPFHPSFLLLFSAAFIPGPTQAQDAPPFQLQVDYSSIGMVAAGQPLATWAGVQMLEAGGNAADAAVAAAFAIAVVEPTMNSIGGRTQILIRLPNGEFRGIDATTQVPATYDPETAPQAAYGYAVIGVPGAVAGLVRLQGEFGTLPLETVMEPAIRYAREGFLVNSSEAGHFSSAAEGAAEFEGTRRYYLRPDGTPFEAGELLVNEDLATTLTTIAKTEGGDFYRGEIARRMAEDIQAHGGAVTLESLRDYRAEDALLVRGSYRGYELVGSYIPSAGALAIEALQILENFDLSSMSPAERTAHVGMALRLAFEDWELQGSPEMAAQLTSKEWAAQRAEEVRVMVGAAGSESVPSAWLGRPAADGLPPGAEDAPEGGADPLTHRSGSHTTHLSTADGTGMMVSLTQTLGPNMGSRVVTPGLGFLYASTLGGYLGRMEPGERARSNICPFMVMENGLPLLVLGGAGGAQIPVAVVNAIVHFVDGGLAFPEAVTAPRVGPGATGGVVLETHEGAGFTPDLVEAVRALGFSVRETPREAAFGRIHGIRYFAETGRWEGVADPDWGGSALGARFRPAEPRLGEGRR